MLGRLNEFAERYPVIGDVRGRGAMVAIELVEPGTKRPNPVAAVAVNKACHLDGVLTLTCGTFGNVMRFLPPLVIDDTLVDEALGVLDKALTNVS
jgi:4-aminobutyrate aminotransferase/(S)-3-amino-2-methylpropionate transaminase